MRLLSTATLILLMSLPAACGDQLVEFGRGPGNGSDNPDDGSSGTATPPTVVATGPSNAAANVSINEQIGVMFSRAMAPATINNATFKVRHGATNIPGVVAYAGGMATFTPTTALDLSLEYTATITTGAMDPSGIALATDYVWSFTTGACSLASLPLHSAGNLAVLGGSTVTSTGATSVTGDLGVSPGTAVTGFPPGILIGSQRAGDPTAALAIGDLLIAYNDAAGRTLCAVTVAGNLGGQTLIPGLYKSTSSLEITSGDLTLDARGDKHAVFIFQMASTLTTTSGRRVILTGGARTGNVFWQVGSSATLGTGSVFEGTIMADQSITMAAGATLNGRLLARIGGVSLDSNTIVMPPR
jgi:hypothetical protein